MTKRSLEGFSCHLFYLSGRWTSSNTKITNNFCIFFSTGKLSRIYPRHSLWPSFIIRQHASPFLRVVFRGNHPHERSCGVSPAAAYDLHGSHVTNLFAPSTKHPHVPHAPPQIARDIAIVTVQPLLVQLFLHHHGHLYDGLASFSS